MLTKYSMANFTIHLRKQIMENKTRSKHPESDMIQIKAINEDTYWSREYGISTENLKNKDYQTAIFDKIVDAHIKSQNSNN